MKIRINSVTLLMLLVLILSGCGKSDEAISNKYLDNINVTLSDQPTSKNSEHSYEISLKNNKNELINVDSVEINLKMKSMNHKVDGKLKKVSKGIYKGKVELPMDGSWDKTIVLKQGKFVRNVKVKNTTIKSKSFIMQYETYATVQ